MTMLKELEKAIEHLELQKNELLRSMQIACWKEDRHENKKIPQKTTIDVLADDIEMLLPEKRLLPSDIGSRYQHWYSAARTILDKNQPSRVGEFEASYSPTGKSVEQGIKQLIGGRYVTKAEQFKLMDIIETQYDIIAAVPTHLRYSIFDVELTAYAVLMDDELAAAQYLLKNGFLRAAGALAGVILERHLKNLLRKHIPPIKYKGKDTLSPLNDLCKETIYDLVAWRKVQHLIDLRNLCDHDRKREPTKDEVAGLISGVSAMIKTYN